MRAVNLLPREAIGVERRRLPAMAPFIAAAAVPVIAIGLVVHGYSSAHSLAGARADQLAVLEASMPKTTSSAATTDTAGLLQLGASIGARRLALDDALGKQMAWDTTLRDIARLIPAGAWLTSMSVTSSSPPDVAVAAPPPAPTTGKSATSTTTTASSPPPAPAAATSGFTISGYASSEENLALLLTRLQLLPSLANVTLGSATNSGIGNKTVVQFNITAGFQSVTGGAQT